MGSVRDPTARVPGLPAGLMCFILLGYNRDFAAFHDTFNFSVAGPACTAFFPACHGSATATPCSAASPVSGGPIIYPGRLSKRADTGCPQRVRTYRAGIADQADDRLRGFLRALPEAHHADADCAGI